MDGKTQAAAAAASSMSLRTAREWDTGPAPSTTKQLRDWRTRPDPFAAVWHTDVEPLLRLIEDTPRNKLIDEAAKRVKAGTSYRDLLAALMLAWVRGIEPRPVGFKFHAVLVVHSAHLAALSAADRDRWLPLFWALDNFKSSQAANKQQGDCELHPFPGAARAFSSGGH